MFQESKQGAVTVVSVSGPLTVENVPQAAEILERCCQSGTPRAVFDLARMPLIDSAGLELLLNAHEQFERRGGAFKVAGASPLCVDALSVTGIVDQLEVYDELTQAIRSYLR